MMLISISHTGNTIGCVFPWADKVHGDEVRKGDLLKAPFHIHLLFHYLQPGASDVIWRKMLDVCEPHSNHTD